MSIQTLQAIHKQVNPSSKSGQLRNSGGSGDKATNKQRAKGRKFMGRRSGPKGLVPRRNKPKNGHQKRMQTVSPTPELLKQKAVAQGTTARRARTDLSLDPIELLRHFNLITDRQHQAGYKFGALRVSAYGKATPSGGQAVMVHEHLSSDDAPDQMLTDEEKEDRRERWFQEYQRACACLKTMGRGEFEAVQRLVVDQVELNFTQLAKAKRGLSTLADLWKIPAEE